MQRPTSKLKKTGTLAAFLWNAIGKRPGPDACVAQCGDIPPVTDEAVKLSKALKKAGFRFVGPTSMYAFMQSTGMVNDHLVDCPRHDCVREAAARVRSRRRFEITDGQRRKEHSLSRQPRAWQRMLSGGVDL